MNIDMNHIYHVVYNVLDERSGGAHIERNQNGLAIYIFLVYITVSNKGR